MSKLVRHLDRILLLYLLHASGGVRVVAALRAHLPYLLRGHIFLIDLAQILEYLLDFVNLGRVLSLLHIQQHLLVDLLYQVELFGVVVLELVQVLERQVVLLVGVGCGGDGAGRSAHQVVLRARHGSLGNARHLGRLRTRRRALLLQRELNGRSRPQAQRLLLSIRSLRRGRPHQRLRHADSAVGLDLIQMSRSLLHINRVTAAQEARLLPLVRGTNGFLLYHHITFLFGRHDVPVQLLLQLCAARILRHRRALLDVHELALALVGPWRSMSLRRLALDRQTNVMVTAADHYVDLVVLAGIIFRLVQHLIVLLMPRRHWLRRLGHDHLRVSNAILLLVSIHRVQDGCERALAAPTSGSRDARSDWRLDVLELLMQHEILCFLHFVFLHDLLGLQLLALFKCILVLHQ